MKLSRDAVQAREQFIIQAVRADPKVTGEQLQELLHQHFGKKMRLVRLYKLKKQALDSLPKKLSMDPRFSPHPPDPYDP